MHLTEALSVMDNEYPEGLHNIIVIIFDMVLKDVPVITPHTLSQLEV